MLGKLFGKPGGFLRLIGGRPVQFLGIKVIARVVLALRGYM